MEQSYFDNAEYDQGDTYQPMEQSVSTGTHITEYISEPNCMAKPSRNWIGAEHWRLRFPKIQSIQCNFIIETAKTTDTLKKKGPFRLEFGNTIAQDESLFLPGSNNNKSLDTNSSFDLPEDYCYGVENFKRLFLKSFSFVFLNIY